MPYKTPEEDIKRFESFLDELSDTEFDILMKLPEEDGGFSPKQKDLADDLREQTDDTDFDLPLQAHKDALQAFYKRFNIP